jgi:hypothetical protein
MSFLIPVPRQSWILRQPIDFPEDSHNSSLLVKRLVFAGEPTTLRFNERRELALANLALRQQLGILKRSFRKP